MAHNSTPHDSELTQACYSGYTAGRRALVSCAQKSINMATCTYRDKCFMYTLYLKKAKGPTTRNKPHIDKPTMDRISRR